MLLPMRRFPSVLRLLLPGYFVPATKQEATLWPKLLPLASVLSQPGQLDEHLGFGRPLPRFEAQFSHHCGAEGSGWLCSPFSAFCRKFNTLPCGDTKGDALWSSQPLVWHIGNAEWHLASILPSWNHVLPPWASLTHRSSDEHTETWTDPQLKSPTPTQALEPGLVWYFFLCESFTRLTFESEILAV